ncbi:MAG: hypothetical protein IV100_21300 [Myxococcales bacterium]|nr:hypothetical protein [Myxococcales bacterium]
MHEGLTAASLAALAVLVGGCLASSAVESVPADATVLPSCTGARVCDVQRRNVFCQSGATPTLLESCVGPALCVDGACQCQPSCSGRVCGGDGCGGRCGECDDGFACDAGLCAPACHPAGTGTQVGDVVESLEFIADVASPGVGGSGRWSLAGRCTRGATLFIESAVWCDTCAPALTAAFAAFGARSDVQIVVALGETTPGVPPSSTDLAAYRDAMGIPSSTPIVLDPLFEGLASAIDHAGGGLPFFIWLDSDLRIVARGLMGGAPDFAGLGDLPRPIADSGN